jgi:hypothetical protein
MIYDLTSPRSNPPDSCNVMQTTRHSHAVNKREHQLLHRALASKTSLETPPRPLLVRVTLRHRALLSGTSSFDGMSGHINKRSTPLCKHYRWFERGIASVLHSRTITRVNSDALDWDITCRTPFCGCHTVHVHTITMAIAKRSYYLMP